MTRIEVSRRNLLATGACALVGAVSLPEVVCRLGAERLGPAG
jgi:hypothetical protein